MQTAIVPKEIEIGMPTNPRLIGAPKKPEPTTCEKVKLVVQPIFDGFTDVLEFVPDIWTICDASISISEACKSFVPKEVKIALAVLASLNIVLGLTLIKDVALSVGRFVTGPSGDKIYNATYIGSVFTLISGLGASGLAQLAELGYKVIDEFFIVIRMPRESFAKLLPQIMKIAGWITRISIFKEGYEIAFAIKLEYDFSKLEKTPWNEEKARKVLEVLQKSSSLIVSANGFRGEEENDQVKLGVKIGELGKDLAGKKPGSEESVQKFYKRMRGNVRHLTFVNSLGLVMNGTAIAAMLIPGVNIVAVNALWIISSLFGIAKTLEEKQYVEKAHAWIVIKVTSAAITRP